MKPKIVIWAYLGLGYLLLTHILDTVLLSNNIPDNIPLLPAAIVIATTVAIYGMVKRALWARMMAFSVVIVDVLSALGHGMYLQRVMPEELGTNILISSLVFVVIFSFLAYKLYTSDELKTYLST